VGIRARKADSQFAAHIPRGLFIAGHKSQLYIGPDQPAGSRGSVIACNSLFPDRPNITVPLSLARESRSNKYLTTTFYSVLVSFFQLSSQSRRAAILGRRLQRDDWLILNAAGARLSDLKWALPVGEMARVLLVQGRSNGFELVKLVCRIR
jgi:hypothetical protein